MLSVRAPCVHGPPDVADLARDERRVLLAKQADGDVSLAPHEVERRVAHHELHLNGWVRQTERLKPAHQERRHRVRRGHAHEPLRALIVSSDAPEQLGDARVHRLGELRSELPRVVQDQPFRLPGSELRAQS